MNIIIRDLDTTTFSLSKDGIEQIIKKSYTSVGLTDDDTLMLTWHNKERNANGQENYRLEIADEDLILPDVANIEDFYGWMRVMLTNNFGVWVPEGTNDGDILVWSNTGGYYGQGSWEAQPNTGGGTKFKKLNFTGTIDSGNRVFTITDVGYTDIMVFWNGQAQGLNAAVNGYSVVGAVVTLTDTPQAPDDWVEIWGNI